MIYVTHSKTLPTDLAEKVLVLFNFLIATPNAITIFPSSLQSGLFMSWGVLIYCFGLIKQNYNLMFVQL